MDASWHETFVDFGEDPLMPFPRTPLSRIESEKTDELRSLVSRNTPKLPGVYGMLDATGKLIYVGKSKSLRPADLRQQRDDRSYFWICEPRAVAE